MIRLGIDISSGEESPKALFESLIEYSQQYADDQLYVFVDQDNLNKIWAGSPLPGNFTLVPVSETITMTDNPIKAIREKKNSSIVVGLEYLKEQKIDTFFSPGNTGAVVYGAQEILGMVKDIHFPAIAVLLPNIYHDVVLLDAGSSFYIDEDMGLNLAIMGNILYKNLFAEPNPKLGVLNIGKEKLKGPKWVRKLDKYLTKDKNFDYFGFVEGFDLFTSKCNVFITGGYTGNILLKGIEGVYYFVKKLMQSKAPELVAALKEEIHYSRSGAGIVLGTKGAVFIGHGITNPEALKNALHFSKNIYKFNLPQKIDMEMKKRSILSKFWNRKEN